MPSRRAMKNGNKTFAIYCWMRCICCVTHWMHCVGGRAGILAFIKRHQIWPLFSSDEMAKYRGGVGFADVQGKIKSRLLGNVRKMWGRSLSSTRINRKDCQIQTLLKLQHYLCHAETQFSGTKLADCTWASLKLSNKIHTAQCLRTHVWHAGTSPAPRRICP